MSDYSANNKTISDEISKKDPRSNKEYKIIIPLRLLIRERTQCILPDPPQFDHLLNTPSLDNNQSVTIVHPITYHIITYL